MGKTAPSCRFCGSPLRHTLAKIGESYGVDFAPSASQWMSVLAVSGVIRP